jgi:hypothetical protein
MSKPSDVFDAARQVAEILEPFENTDRERIVRWAREQVGMVVPLAEGPRAAGTTAAAASPSTTVLPSAQTQDIRSFIAAKNPKNDTQLAAVVAYYNRFVSPDRKDTLTKQDLVDACRLAVRRQPKSVAQTLVNAYAAGVFDKVDRGHYTLNSVGENLVAISLPERDGSAEIPSTKRKKAKAKSTGATRRRK